VLLIGEPGCGREAFARYLHGESQRASAPFVAVIGSSLREEDAEEQLLGRGSTPGLLEQADAGTLFIHELEDLPASAQRVLLGVIESGMCMRLGSSEAHPFAARLASSAQPGIEDVPELLRHYVDRAVDAESLPFRRFSVAAQNRLRNYPWPDNVRELKNLVQRLLIQGGPEEIRLDEIERELSIQSAPGEPLVKQDLLALPLREAREQFERAYLQQQLLLCNGKVGQLAKRVGMERTHLYRKLRSLGVDFRNISED
jgi:two-component system, NtrC family, nitrogen regulation response regulator NtrX